MFSMGGEHGAFIDGSGTLRRGEACSQQGHGIPGVSLLSVRGSNKVQA